MEDNIVRIYRRKEGNGGLFGVVEEAGAEGRKALFRLNARVLEGDALKLHIMPACFGLIRQSRVASISGGPDPRIVGVVFR